MRTCLVILGDQLFAPQDLKVLGPHTTVFMAEAWDLCTHFRYHKQKLLLFLASMRHYRDELKAAGFTLDYRELDPANTAKSFLDSLKEHVLTHKIERLLSFEISDSFCERSLQTFCQSHGLRYETQQTPGFLTPRAVFADYLKRHKQVKMQTFYQEQRLRLKVMVDKDGQAWGGRWSFDTENRKKLPAKLVPPPLPPKVSTEYTKALIPFIEKHFAHHPGDLGHFIWPVTRSGAQQWLKTFLKERFELFGPYEDAITTRSELVFHSGLSPLINIGLLTPQEVLTQCLKAAEAQDIELASLEGFVRQLIGWREFIFGIARNFEEAQASRNFFKHERRLGEAWYKGETGLPPLDHSIRQTLRLGYVHHIERLMLLSNVMLLCEIHPQEVYRWFMELFIDSADWVMGPNVYGMGQFSDGGIFATKPYIAGSNYIFKMSDYPKDTWSETMDGLYWRFIAKHRSYFASQPRLSMMSHMLDKIPQARLNSIAAKAEDFLAQHTRLP